MDIILTLHIIGAFASIWLMVMSLIVIIFARKEAENMMAASLKISALFVTVTGTMLVIFVPGVSILSVCLKGFFVLTAIVIVHFFLRRRFATSKS